MCLLAGGSWGLLVAAGMSWMYWWCAKLAVVLLVPGEFKGVPMSSSSCKIMSWNVRGLNMPVKREGVRQVAASHKVVILCMQETKIDVWTRQMVLDIGGGSLLDCVVLPALGTCGGVAIFWNRDVISVVSQAIGEFSITALVTVISTSERFFITTVYGPTDDSRKDDFLHEITRYAPPRGSPWLINGDFNVIYEARDKSNLNLNRRIMGRFRAAIDTAALREIKCKNRRFTWSNERESPTLVSIDKFFANAEWEALFPSFMLMAASTSCSDHCPLLLASSTAPPTRARFRFEGFWPKFPHFRETVQRAWQRPVSQTCAFARVKTKMERVAKDLKLWSNTLFSDAKVQFHMVNELILRFDVAMEKRQLTAQELSFRKLLKQRVLGLAAVERARRRQASRVTWLRAGDANTSFFNAKINSRRRKNFIQHIRAETHIATDHEDKSELIRDHFQSILGTKK